MRLKLCFLLCPPEPLLTQPLCGLNLPVGRVLRAQHAQRNGQSHESQGWQGLVFSPVFCSVWWCRVICPPWYVLAVIEEDLVEPTVVLKVDLPPYVDIGAIRVPQTLTKRRLILQTGLDLVLWARGRNLRLLSQWI